MNELVYPKERTLGGILLVLGIIAWLLLIIGTFGIALIFLLIGFVAYLFAQSALIAHVKGNGVMLSQRQLPELYRQFTECCEKLQIDAAPEIYVLNGNGTMNAFATKFLGSQFVVLLSDVIDAVGQSPDGVRFYIGHELGHLRMKHVHFGHLLRWPVLWLPLIGAAYARARESTCDRHGAACCSAPEHAAAALSALAAGARVWPQVDVKVYVGQVRQTSGFWMSFHELVAGYPWLSKRAARILVPNATLPGRNPFAYLIAVFIPYAGRAGSAFGALMMVYVIGVLAAVAIPQYEIYTGKAQLSVVMTETAPARSALTEYYLANGKVADSLEEVGINANMPDGTVLALDSQTMVLTATAKRGQLVFVPKLFAGGHIKWGCQGGKGLSPAMLPPTCQALTE